MKYYIEKQGDLVTAKGVTVDNAQLNERQIEVTKEEFESIQQYILPIEPQPIIDVDTELAEEITAATTLEELKSALLGKNGIARVKGRIK